MQRLLLGLAVFATLGLTASTTLAQSPDNRDNRSHNPLQLLTTDMGHVGQSGVAGLLYQVGYPRYRPYHHHYYRPYGYRGYYPYYWGSSRPYYYHGFYRPYPRFHQGFYHWGGHWK